MGVRCSYLNAMSAKTDTIGRRDRTTPSSAGKRVHLTVRDQIWLEAIDRHGPLASSFLHAYTEPLGMYEKRAKERLCDLFHEDNTPDGAAYLVRPRQQFQTLDSRYNQLVYDLGAGGKRALKRAGSGSDRSGPSGGPWWHRFMASSITASVEIGTLGREDVSFIAQGQILDRAETSLECPVTYVDPASRKRVTKSLKPDAVFGLEYHTPQGSRFRFFVVEADRATEPLTTRNWNRKSAERSFAQYAEYIGRGVYKAHLNLRAPLLVLNVTTSNARCARMIETLSKQSPGGNDYLLFQHWDAFETPAKIPKPNLSFLEGTWQRAGLLPRGPIDGAM